MREALKKHHDSIKTALAGIVWSVKTQPNFRIHLTLSLLVLFAGWWVGISSIEMTILVFAIVLGLSAEMINTALESMTDLITTEWRQEAKIAKDVSAGMMLLVALGVVIVAILIFGPYLFG